ncbi:MAG: bifunctional UDP-N-acetylglucosamine diphosphorylase/glucosamine-1-phosphate N-acetyltransferase GlmU [Planctomycetota bacterium]|nr:MAG: bifunctional UDP-N-acetylglucosamine diphosphorylase/glucosamine-1-phosphate N-acetyltransferase GlmU [Planctomycetota bacterium]
MSQRPLAVVVLAAGKGTRTKLDLPKVLLPLCGAPLLEHVLDTAAALQPDELVVVLHHGMHEIAERLDQRFEELQALIVDQGEPLGTGHAMQRAMEELDRKHGQQWDGDILVLYGDAPLIREETLRALVEVLGDEALGAEAGELPEALAGKRGAASLLSCDAVPVHGLGRVLRDEEGFFVGIREQKDCSEEELEIDEINTGFCCFTSAALRQTLPELSNANKQGEYYLTDCFGLLVEKGELVVPVMTDDGEQVQGINDLGQLAAVRDSLQERIHLDLLAKGVLIEDPATTVIERGVEIGRGTTVFPFTVIHSGVVIGENCEVGPFSHLRVGAVLEDRAEVGNFVEMKKSVLGQGSKAKHLTYLGNAEIGKKVNVGAGTITANYDGKHKHLTEIADGAFIGSGTVIVAPAKIGKKALTGAGALVKRGSDVPEGQVVVGVPARPLVKKNEDASAKEEA